MRAPGPSPGTGTGGSPAVEARGLARRFGQVEAVRGIDLKIARGEVFGILGANGAGKTTTLRLLTGIIAPTSGTVRILGIDVVREPDRVRPRIGYVAQAFGLYGDLTAAENLAFYASLYGPPDPAALDALLEHHGFSALRGRLARDLSGGYRTRLALLTALAHEPELLFLDEPTAGIDPVTRKELWDLFYALKAEGKTLVVTTHYMEEAERCDRLAFICAGRIAALGTPRELRASLGGYEVLEVAAAYRPGVVERVAALPEVETANQLGPVLRVVCRGGKEAARVLTRALEPLGVSAGEVRRAEPSLEDVFVVLTRRAVEGPAGRAASPAAGSEPRRGEEPRPRDEGGTGRPGRPVPLPQEAAPAVPTGREGERETVWLRLRRGARALRAMARKELTHLRREPRLLALLVATPTVLLLLFGYALRLRIENLRVAVWDRDRSFLSLELKDRLRREAGFDLLEVSSEKEMRESIAAGRARLGIIIPADLSRRLTDNQQAKLRVLVDGTMPAVAQAALYGAGVLTSDETAEALTFSDPDRPAPPLRPRPIALEREVLFNPGLRDADFFLPGIIGVVIMQVTLIITSVGLVREKEQHTLEQLLVTPISRSALVAGKMVPYLAIAAADFAVFLLIGHLVFDLPLRSSPAATATLALLFILSLLSLGALVSTLSETQPQAIFMSIFVFIPSILLSGFIFPIEAMPEWLQPISWVFPMTYYVEAVRDVVLKGLGPAAVLHDLAALGGFFVAFSVASVAGFRRRLA